MVVMSAQRKILLRAPARQGPHLTLNGSLSDFENSRTADSKNVPFLSFQSFLAEKLAVKEKKARFDPFVPPTHFQQ